MVTFGQSSQYKSYGKYSNLLPCKISYFYEFPKYFSYFYSLLLIYSIGKRKLNWKKGVGPFSPRRPRAALPPSPISRAKRPVTISHTAVPATWGPPVGALSSPIFPSSVPTCRGRHRFRPLLCSVPSRGAWRHY
jgi:hypothetical protein